MKLTREAREHLLAVTRPALLLAPRGFIGEIGDRLNRDGVQAAVAARDTAALYDWAMAQIILQGIGDRAALAHAQRAGIVSWQMVTDALAEHPPCPRLRSHWHYAGCGFRREAWRCAELHHLGSYPVPRLPARKGGLAVAATSLWLFLRDVAGGDLVGWIDWRLSTTDPGIGERSRAAAMREAVLSPLYEVAGIGPKVWALLLADLLLAGDPNRERWVTAGAAMVAIDSLVHAFLHRTGALRHAGADHTYGPACHAPGGCADLIDALARMIDAGEFDSAAPPCCPRLVQHALWFFAAEGGWAICNGRQIDDRAPCDKPFCTAGPYCERISLHPPRLSRA